MSNLFKSAHPAVKAIVTVAGVAIGAAGALLYTVAIPKDVPLNAGAPKQLAAACRASAEEQEKGEIFFMNCGGIW